MGEVTVVAGAAAACGVTYGAGAGSCGTSIRTPPSSPGDCSYVRRETRYNDSAPPYQPVVTTECGSCVVTTEVTAETWTGPPGVDVTSQGAEQSDS